MVFLMREVVIMADIQLTPEELLSQSTEMFNLQNEYESLFQQVKNSLEGINNSWSPNLASNFSGKITSAQNSFSSIINMFGNGANAAKASATRFGTPSSWLSNIQNVIQEYGTNMWEIANLTPEEIESIFPTSEAAERASTIGSALETANKAADNVASSNTISWIQGIVETVGETVDPNHDMSFGLQDEMDRLARNYVEAENNNNYLDMAYNGFMMAGIQTNYNIFNTATNVLGDVVGAPSAVAEAVSSAADSIPISDERLAGSIHAGANFVGNMSRIGSSFLKNLM